MKLRAGILLSGCGAYDGSDPHETVLLMSALQEAGMAPLPLALDRPQLHVVDHTSGLEVEGESRAQFTEASRLVRGKLHPLAEISPKLLDALVIPGGQGVVKNLMEGFGRPQAQEVEEDVLSFVAEAHRHGAWIAAVSLAEFLVSAVLGPWPEGVGCFALKPTEVYVDREARRLLTPGNLLCNSLPELHEGMRALSRTLCDLVAQARQER